jgi:hypothetical protein
MHPRIAMFLQARDRAYARRDAGIVRAMNNELRRLGIRDDATLAHPNGPPKPQPEGAVAVAEKPRQARQKCEHGNVADRCTECNPELLAK